MDKNTITGFILIAAILIVFSWWNQPSEEQVAELRKQDSIAAVEKQKAEQASKAKAEAEKAKKADQLAEIAQDTTALFHQALQGSAQDVVLKNSKLELTFSTKGATIQKAIIKGFEDRVAIPT